MMQSEGVPIWCFHQKWKRCLLHQWQSYLY
jgi:hypothetical protein